MKRVYLPMVRIIKISKFKTFVNTRESINFRFLMSWFDYQRKWCAFLLLYQTSSTHDVILISFPPFSVQGSLFYLTHVTVDIPQLFQFAVSLVPYVQVSSKFFLATQKEGFYHIYSRCWKCHRHKSHPRNTFFYFMLKFCWCNCRHYIINPFQIFFMVIIIDSLFFFVSFNK